MPQAQDIAVAEGARSRVEVPPREFYIDRLRTVMTVLVVLHHTAITYGAAGGWFYYENKPSGAASSVLLTLFCATNQAYFMGLFFLLAGYFTYSSLQRKGYGRFIGDRFLRLGLPLLLFVLLLGPVAAAEANTKDGFWNTLLYLWRHGVLINGPMWFVQALLMLSLLYCAVRAVLGPRGEQPSRVPSAGWWLLGAVAVGLGAVAIRQFVPTGVNVLGLQLGYFSSYIFLFAVGIAARRHDWLNQLQWRHARPWLIAVVVAWPALPVAIALSGALHGAKVSFGGGTSWPAILYAFWEPFVAWGLIAGWLLVFRDRVNRASPLWSWMNRRAYTVYFIHPVVLVGMALLLHGWQAPALLKFAACGTLACAACWLIADPLVRAPGLRRIL